MVSNRTILLCFFVSFSASIRFSDGESHLNDVFDVSQNVQKLSDVDVLMDDQVTSLSKEFGERPDSWNIGKDNAGKFARIASIALACNHSKIITRLVEESVQMYSPLLYASVARETKRPLLKYDNNIEDYRTAALDILSSTSYYSSRLGVAPNKAFFTAALAAHIFFSKTSLFQQSTPNPTAVFNTQFSRICSYVRNSLELFTSEFCVNGDRDDWTEYAEPLPLSDLDSIENQHNRHMFGIDNLTLTAIMETELITGKSSSRVKNLLLDFPDRQLTLDAVRKHVVDGYDADNFAKLQYLTVDCVAGIAFYLINNIIKTDRNPRPSSGGAVDDSVGNALSALESLRCTGNLGSTVKNIKFKRQTRPHDQRVMANEIGVFFRNSNIKQTSLDKLFGTETTANNDPADSVDLLNTFVEKIKQLKPTLFVVTQIAREPYPMPFESRFRFGVAKSNSGRRSSSSNVNLLALKKHIYHFSLFAIKHFMLSDVLVKICERLAEEEKRNSDSGQEVVRCFSDVENYSIKSIKPIFKLFYGGLIKSFLDNTDYVGRYYSVFEAMYSLLLYLNDSQFDSKDAGTPGMERIRVKLGKLLRFSVVIGNLLKSLINRNNVVVDYQLSVHLDRPGKENSGLSTVDHVVGQITENLDKYNSFFNKHRGKMSDDDDDEVGYPCEKYDDDQFDNCAFLDDEHCDPCADLDDEDRDPCADLDDEDRDPCADLDDEDCDPCADLDDDDDDEDDDDDGGKSGNRDSCDAEVVERRLGDVKDNDECDDCRNSGNRDSCEVEFDNGVVQANGDDENAKKPQKDSTNVLDKNYRNLSKWKINKAGGDSVADDDDKPYYYYERVPRDFLLNNKRDFREVIFDNICTPLGFYNYYDECNNRWGELVRFESKDDYGYLELGKFLYGEIVGNAAVHGYYCSLIDRVSVAWVDGVYFPVKTLYKIVENKTHPRYVYEFIKAMQRVFVFTVSEKLKDIVKTVIETENVSITELHRHSIQKSLGAIRMLWHPAFYGYTVGLLNYLFKISNSNGDADSCERLIDIIEKQQVELGVQLPPTVAPSSETAELGLDKSVENFAVFTMHIGKIVNQFVPTVLVEWKNVADLTSA